ncbi:hypothetical protein WH50_06420 [Pokkaliibacter plantistimulans]|uniref:Conjugal transfer protein TrbL n=1 Tax=Pokkaliibacter plantistimulans TaxID=1635171 RepID=A0ABX5LZI8_9GAMM|nr:type IV secretion system protein [Pokkaliibacter plantistimulans]PXF32089.1 hypothetical protein WH50_06420 [Pokkaliibacter plantistimulans]
MSSAIAIALTLALVMLVISHRRQFRLQAEIRQLRSKYKVTPSVNNYGLIEKIKRVKFQKWLPALFLLSPLIYAAYATAAEGDLSNGFRGVFEGNLKTFVTNVMSGKGDYNIWVEAAFATFAILGLFIEITKWTMSSTGYDWQKGIEFLIYFFATVLIKENYDTVTQAIFNLGDGLGDALSTGLTGSEDGFKVVNWLKATLSSITLDDIDLSDGITIVVMSLIFSFFIMLLEGLVYVVSVWGELGYALAKIIGLVFVPFLLLEGTRNYFDSWFRFFLGFIVLVFMQKAVLVVVIVVMQSAMVAVGMIGGGLTVEQAINQPMKALSLTADDLHTIVDLIIYFALCIVLLISAFSFSSTLAQGFGSVSGGLNSVAKNGAALAIRKLLLKV